MSIAIIVLLTVAITVVLMIAIHIIARAITDWIVNR